MRQQKKSSARNCNASALLRASWSFPAKATPNPPPPMAAPLAGSIQEAALANPLVQRAQEIFKAEVRSVVDLRNK